MRHYRLVSKVTILSLILGISSATQAPSLQTYKARELFSNALA